METAGVQAALLQQPAVYAQDYSYLEATIDEAPWRLRGVLLFDPSRGAQEGAVWLRDMARSRRWVGVRFDPELFFEAGMAGEAGQAIFVNAGRLKLAVVFGCAGGLARHAPGIRLLLEESSETNVVIEDMGCLLQPVGQSSRAGDFGQSPADEESWQSLLTFARYSQVYIQVAGFTGHPQESMRLGELLRVFGASRLMWGSNFPFEHPAGDPYKANIDAVRGLSSWQDLSASDQQDLLAGTAARVFGRPHHDDHFKALLASVVAWVLLSLVVASCAMYLVTPVQQDTTSAANEGTEMASTVWSRSPTFTSRRGSLKSGAPNSYVTSGGDAPNSYVTSGARSYAR